MEIETEPAGALTSNVTVAVILAPERHHKILSAQVGVDRMVLVSTLEQLRALDVPNNCVLLAFGSGVIVPGDVLARYARAYNFHGSSPEYPGRDPHHWAVYDGVTMYGVTCHRMTAKVDEGSIVAVDLFEANALSPQELRRESEKWLLTMFARLAQRLANADLADCGAKWSGTKRSRADLHAMLDCRGLPTLEVERRRRAFEGFHFVV